VADVAAVYAAEGEEGGANVEGATDAAHAVGKAPAEEGEGCECESAGRRCNSVGAAGELLGFDVDRWVHRRFAVQHRRRVAVLVLETGGRVLRAGGEARGDAQGQSGGEQQRAGNEHRLWRAGPYFDWSLGLVLQFTEAVGREAVDLMGSP